MKKAKCYICHMIATKMFKDIKRLSELRDSLYSVFLFLLLVKFNIQALY